METCKSINYRKEEVNLKLINELLGPVCIDLYRGVPGLYFFVDTNGLTKCLNKKATLAAAYPLVGDVLVAPPRALQNLFG